MGTHNLCSRTWRGLVFGGFGLRAGELILCASEKKAVWQANEMGEGVAQAIAWHTPTITGVEAPAAHGSG